MSGGSTREQGCWPAGGAGPRAGRSSEGCGVVLRPGAEWSTPEEATAESLSSAEAEKWPAQTAQASGAAGESGAGQQVKGGRWGTVL